MSYFKNVNIIQNVTVDDNNSSSVNLAAGGTFTGTYTSTLGIVGIQVSLKADQNCHVYVDQSPDYENWDITDSFNYYTIHPFGVTVQAVNSYVRIRVTNNNSVTGTTVFRLQTALCPIVEAIPRALSSEGNLKVGVYEIEGTFGTKVQVTPRYELKTVQSTRLVGAGFTGIILDTSFWTASPSAGGTATIATGGVQDGFCTLATNTTANGAIKLTTRRYARYVSGYAQDFNAAIRLPVVTGANTRMWGAYDASDGFYFHHDGTTLSIGTRGKGVDSELISSGSFNGDLGATYVISSTLGYNYEIIWLSTKVSWFIDGELLHSITTSSGVNVSTFTLPATFECNNTDDNQNNNKLILRNAGIHRLGQLVTQPTYKYQSGLTAGVICKYGAGNILGISVSGVANNSVVTLYDNIAASGEVIWSSGAQGANAVPFSINFYGLPFSTGLTLAITAATSTVTVIYE